jgi:precorrin-6B methylase 2
MRALIPSRALTQLALLLAASAQLHCTPAATSQEVRSSSSGEQAGAERLAYVAPSEPASPPSRSDESQPPRKPDVPYEPSSPDAIAAMIKLGAPGPEDVVYDLGCGDGRVVIEAVKQSGARGVCIDIDPARIAEARENAQSAGVVHRVSFRTEDLFTTDIREASVVMLFLWPEINLRLLPRLLSELAPGSRIVSNMHDMGSFAPEQVIRTKSPKTGQDRGVYLWRVPTAQAPGQKRP